MKYVFFSDIHGNLEALESVISFLRREKPDFSVFVGDAVGYGADPAGVVSLLQALPFPLSSVAGNHDWAVLGKTDIDCFNPMAREAVLWTADRLRQCHFSFLESFPLVFGKDEFKVVHGSLYRPDRFYYIFSSTDARRCFDLLQKKICFVGHTHCPGIYACGKNAVRFFSGEHLRLCRGWRYLVNVGSVGQPRDRDPRACLCSYDSVKEIVSYHRLEYNIASAAAKIRKAGLPLFLAERLLLGC